MQMKRKKFFLIGKFLVRVLVVLTPANAMLQSQSVDVCAAGELIRTSLESLKEIRKETEISELTVETESAQAAESPADVEPATPVETANVSAPRPKRKRVQSKHLGGSVVLSTLGHTDSDNPTSTPSKSLKKSLLNILDRAISELENRFSKKNLDLMTAVSSLIATSSTFLDSSALEPLHALAATGTDYMTLKNEMVVAKPMLMRACANETDLSTICKTVHKYKDAFPVLHRVYVTALVIGVSSASCESSFSTLARVLTPYRRTMLHGRKRNLVILAHEKSLTNKLNMDDFVKTFSRTNRRLLL